MSIMPVDTVGVLKEIEMATILGILGLIQGLQQMRSGDRLGGAATMFGSGYNSFNRYSQPQYNNILGDFGVRRNQY